MIQITAAAAARPTPTIPITTAACAGPPSGARCLARAPNAQAAPDIGIENRNDVPSDISSSPTLSTPSTMDPIARPLLSGWALGTSIGSQCRGSGACGWGSALGGAHPADAGGGPGGTGGTGGAGSKRGGACPPGARGGSQPRISDSSAIASAIVAAAVLEALAEGAPAIAERGER